MLNIKDCKTKEELINFFEEASCSGLEYWEEADYKEAREHLSNAMGNPQMHYEQQLSEEEMFYCDIEKFLTFEWMVHYYKIYKVWPCSNYAGFSLVAADSVEEANEIIQKFREEDKNNSNDSYGYEDVDEDNLVDGIVSARKGLIVEGIFYIG